MFEVEAKVKLTQADLRRLRKELPGIAQFVKKVVKRDHYIGYLPKYSFRIRNEEGDSTLHLKEKKVEGGIESNTELDFAITSPKKGLSLLRSLNIKMPLKKRKSGEIYRHKNIQIEINRIRGLGYFLEIENVVDRESSIPKAKEELHEIFEKLGFKPSQFEKRYYLEMLADISKN